MKKERKTDEQILRELDNLRQKVTELEKSETSCRIAEQKLTEERNLLRTLIDNLPDFIYVKDRESRFITGNKAVSHLMGVSSPEGLTNKTDFDFYPKTIAQAFYRDEQEIINSGRPIINQEEIAVDPEGKKVWLSTTKVPLRNSQGEIIGIVGMGRNITKQKEVEDALRESEEKYRLVVENATEAIVIAQDDYLKFVNPKTLEIMGHSEEYMLSRPFLEFVHPDDRSMLYGNYSKRIKGEKAPETYQFRVVDRQGNTKWLQISAMLITWETRPATLNFLIDITDRKNTEMALIESQEQLLQAQKMEAIGRLAGGIAHDFNNLLTAILGFTDMILKDPGLSKKSHSYADQVKKSADRAAALTQQLLAFSRKQILKPKILNINELVDRIERMLLRLIGENINLVTSLDQDLGMVRADPGQMEQIIMNLVLNARDAMPSGGKLTMETKNVRLDENFCRQKGAIVPGNYVLLTVRDTGCGIDKETIKHIFEPFYTTKELGRGTGLGLSTVYGIVKQSGGYIYASSRKGQGATFDIYLPRVDVEENAAEHAHTWQKPAGGSETILLAEDEEAVRRIIATSLNMLGYTVIEARDGKEALKLCRGDNRMIDLLITDIVMPGISGPVLAQKMIERYPEMKVLYVSGYANDSIAHHGILNGEIPFMQKPFTRQALAERIREILDG